MQSYFSICNSMNSVKEQTHEIIINFENRTNNNDNEMRWIIIFSIVRTHIHRILELSTMHEFENNLQLKWNHFDMSIACTMERDRNRCKIFGIILMVNHHTNNLIYEKKIYQWIE